MARYFILITLLMFSFSTSLLAMVDDEYDPESTLLRQARGMDPDSDARSSSSSSSIASQDSSSQEGIHQHLLRYDDVRNLPLMWEAFSYAMPYMLAKITLAINGISDAYIYGRLGGDTLASESIALTWRFLIMGTAMGGLRATTIRAGQLNTLDGSVPNYDLGNVNKAGIITAGTYSLLTLPLFIFSGAIVSSTGIVSDPMIANEVGNYCKGFFWGVPAALCLYSDEMFSIGVQDKNIALIYGTLYPVLAMTLSYPLALGWKGVGIEAMGGEGIGHAASIAAWVCWLTLRTHYGLKSKYRAYHLYSMTHMTPSALKAYLSEFIPLAAVNTLISAKDYLFAQFIAGKGDSYARAYSSVATYFEYLNVAFWGYSSGIVSLVANNDPRSSDTHLMKCKKYMAFSTVTGVGVYAILSLPTFIWKDQYMDFFSGGNLTNEEQSIASLYFYYVCGKALLTTFSTCVEAGLFGLEDVYVPVTIDIGSAITGTVVAGLAYGLFEDPVYIVGSVLVTGTIQSILFPLRHCAVIRSLMAAPNTEDESWTWRSEWGCCGIIPLVKRSLRFCGFFND